MSTPVFVWTPSWQTQEQSEPRTRLAELAGVISLGSDGTNADLKTWSVVLENRFHDEAMAIDLFLASRRGVEAFAWNNPRSLVKLYVCEQWDSVVIANRAGGNAAADRIWTITASFREVTEAGLGPPAIFDTVTIVGNFSPTGATTFVASGVWNYRNADTCDGPFTTTFAGSNSGTILGGLDGIAYVNEQFPGGGPLLPESCGGYNYAQIKAITDGPLFNFIPSHYIVGTGSDGFRYLSWTGTITFSTTETDSTPASELTLLWP
jgi:phage-related protein